MPIISNPVPFTDTGIATVLPIEGVYELHRYAEGVTYIGRSDDVRVRLGQHKAGYDGACTQRSDFFKVEYTTNSAQREIQLLVEFRVLHGRLPRCNERVG